MPIRKPPSAPIGPPIIGESAPAAPSIGGPGVGPRTEAVLRQLELSVNRRLDGILQGEFRGLVPGHGSEAGEAREYQIGDDVRRMDWNVTARLQKAHVRDQIADRELESWLCVDISPSLDFGTVNLEKRDLALAAAAGIGFLSARAGNRMGAVLQQGARPVLIPAKQGRRHLLHILSSIQNSPRATTGTPNLGEAISRTTRLAKRRGMITVISDFLDPADTWTKALSVAAQRHEVLAIEVVDPRELELPNVGLITLVDPESGRTREVQTGSAKLRASYAAAAAEQRAEIARTVRSSGAAHLQLSTDRDWLRELVQHVSTRRHRAAQLGRVGV